MAINTSMQPLNADRFGITESRHLLNRAGFGGDARQIRKLADMGLNKAVDTLVNYGKADEGETADAEVDADIIRPLTKDERQTLQKARQSKDEETLGEYRKKRNEANLADRKQMQEIEKWWLLRMATTPRPVEENLTLMWHGHFATNHRTVRDSYLMYKQNMMFRRHAKGSFAAMAHEIVRDPAMLRFLNNDRNVKRRPNENLARELMELFTIGVGNYSEEDIQEGARALTGNSFNDNDFVFNRRVHDREVKTIFGQRGEYDADGFVNLLLSKKQCSEFISYKIYKHFAADVDYETLSPEEIKVIKAMARRMRNKRYSIAATVGYLLKSEHFYDPSVMGRKIKSPTQLVVGTARVLKTPKPNMQEITAAMGLMGQRLFEPPSVAGWDGGRGWINTSTIFVRHNATTYMITGQLPGRKRRVKNGYDPMVLLEGLDDRSAKSVVDYLCSMMLASELDTQRKQTLVKLARQDTINREELIKLMLAITTMPEYQLC